MSSRGRLAVLFVDDERSNLELFRVQFEDDLDLRVLTALNGSEALEILERETVGVLLSDERMPGMTGVELLARAFERWPWVVRIIVSAYGDATRVLAAMNRGHAHEYILKPWNLPELRECIRRGLTVARRWRELHSRADLAELYERSFTARGPEIVGANGALAPVLERIERVAATDSTVLLLGETGTGKELLAREIHRCSSRAQGAFVALNCAALPENLVESELFGHERGAFTGADRARPGRFEVADGGTLFLDEIGDLPLSAQAKLLRAIEDRRVERVGTHVAREVDFRLVCATHRDLIDLVRAGVFREDLFFRLNVLSVRVPPLRERRGDIRLLIDHFIARYAHRSRGRVTVDPEALAALEAYGWPGNVRELEHSVSRALVMSDEDTLTLEDFCLTFPGPRSIREHARHADAERVRALLLEHGGNFARAARAIGVPRTTLVSRAKKLGLL